jgi:hypothetical protein
MVTPIPFKIFSSGHRSYILLRIILLFFGIMEAVFDIVDGLGGPVIRYQRELLKSPKVIENPGL